MARIVACALAIPIVLYCCAGLALYLLQGKLIFARSRYDPTPIQAGLPEATTHHLQTADGVHLVSWLVRGSGKYLVLYFHGNGGSLAFRIDRIKELVDLGCTVLAIDYRGYGGSTGQPSEPGLYKDADAAYAFARSLGYGPERLILYGESLGTGVATELASKSRVAGVILDAPFSSIADVAADRYWMFPVRLLLRDQFRSDLAIKRIEVPVLILHGEADPVVPIRYGRRLSALGGRNVTFVSFAAAGHVVLGLPAAEARVKDWIETSVRSE